MMRNPATLWTPNNTSVRRRLTSTRYNQIQRLLPYRLFDRKVASYAVDHPVRMPFALARGRESSTHSGKMSACDVSASWCTARFTHDIIALAAFGIDVNSTGATGDSPCPSYEAIESTLTIVSLMLETIRK